MIEISKFFLFYLFFISFKKHNPLCAHFTYEAQMWAVMESLAITPHICISIKRRERELLVKAGDRRLREGEKMTHCFAPVSLFMSISTVGNKSLG